jgi:uncharacterized protein (TIGR03435 family)
VPLHFLIQLAYNVKDFQIQAAPSWLNSDRYDVEAKANTDVTFAQMRPMLRAVLADRLRLSLRIETRELPVYELTVARGGFKIAAIKDGDCVTSSPNASPSPRPLSIGPLNVCGGVRRQILRPVPERTDRIEAVGIAMAKLIEILSGDIDRSIIDKTGFTDVFNVHLEFAPNLPIGEVSGGATAPSLFTALQEQLGLKLEPTRGRADVLVIDHVEKPTPN